MNRLCVNPAVLWTGIQLEIIKLKKLTQRKKYIPVKYSGIYRIHQSSYATDLQDTCFHPVAIPK